MTEYCACVNNITELRNFIKLYAPKVDERTVMWAINELPLFVRTDSELSHLLLFYRPSVFKNSLVEFNNFLKTYGEYEIVSNLTVLGEL